MQVHIERECTFYYAASSIIKVNQEHLRHDKKYSKCVLSYNHQPPQQREVTGLNYSFSNIGTLHATAQIFQCTKTSWLIYRVNTHT